MRHIEVNRDVSWLKTEKATQQNSVPLTFVSLFRNVNAVSIKLWGRYYLCTFCCADELELNINVFISAAFSRGESVLFCVPGGLQCYCSAIMPWWTVFMPEDW